MRYGVLGAIHRTLLRRVVHYLSVVFLGPRRGDDGDGISDTCIILFLASKGSVSFCSSSTQSVSVIIVVAIFSNLECAGGV